MTDLVSNEPIPAIGNVLGKIERYGHLGLPNYHVSCDSDPLVGWFRLSLCPLGEIGGTFLSTGVTKQR